MLCFRGVFGQFNLTVVVIYCPRSIAVTQKFFDESPYFRSRYTSSVISTSCADQLCLLFDCYRLVLHGTVPTHQLGGTLDVIISHGGLRPVDDVGLSDHFLLKWKVGATPPASYSTVVQQRPWSRHDVEFFRSAVATSRLCQPDTWPLDIDEMAALYDSEISSLLDHYEECSDAKRLSCRLGREHSCSDR